MANKIPKTNPELFNKIIHAPDLYTGPDGTGELVGEVNDLIIDYTLGFSRVVNVIDNISETEPWAPPTTETIKDNLGEMGLMNSNSHEFMFLDTTVTPHRIGVPSTSTFAGTQKKYAKVFLGSNLTDSGVVISSHYEDGQYVSENIPLEKVIVSDYINEALKTLKESYINMKLPDNELVTVVVYSETGMPTDIKEYRIYNTNYVKSLRVKDSYISSIELNSNFFSDSDSTLLEIPMNVSLRDLDLTATIRYRNEQTHVLAIDGNKVRLDGIDNYISNIDGKQANINLIYMLDDSEYTLNASGVNQRFINQKYKLVTKETEGNYTVKLYVVPNWVSDEVGYELEYYLYDLDRNDYYYATPYVEMGSNTQPFKSKQYGTEQWITVAVDVNKVNRNSKPYRHVQTFAISLLANGRADTTPWLLRYEDDGKLEYGHNLKAVSVYQAANDYRIDISNNLSSSTSFLNALFYAVKPLINTRIEKSVPAPTHFILNVGGHETEHALAEWNNTIVSQVGGIEGKTVLLHWIRKLGGQTLHLGVSPLIIQTEINSLALRASNEYQYETETLISNFLELPNGSNKVNEFDSNSAITFNEDGSYELLWTSDTDRDGNAIPNTGLKGEWTDGERDVSNRYEVSVAILDRWETSDGVNYIDLLLNGAAYEPGTSVPITGDVTFSFESDFAPSTASIELSIVIRDLDNPSKSAIDSIKITKI